MLNRCNNEERLCLGNDELDKDFMTASSLWHSWCDPIVNYSPTTPIISSITAPYSPSYCRTASSACYSMIVSRNRCTGDGSDSDSNLLSVSSCLCAPEVLSMEFTCSVLGNVSCIQIPGHLDQMSGYRYCSNINQVLTLEPSLTASLRSETTVRIPYDILSAGVTSGPAETGSSPTLQVSASSTMSSLPSTSTFNAAALIRVDRGFLLLSLVLGTVSIVVSRC